MRFPILLPFALAGVLAAQEPAPATPDPAARYRTPDWRADFPIPLAFPTASPSTWYDRTRRRALERLVANLQGNVRREVWQMATEFFWRAPPEAYEPLVAAMDRAMLDPTLADLVKNTVEAMGKMADERFDEALRRALEHPSPAVRQAVYAALATSGKAETVRVTYPFFLQMDGRARAAWLRAARLRLGDGAVAMFREIMTAQVPVLVRDAVLTEVLNMPMAQAVEVLAPLWDIALPEFKLVLAGVLHAGGDLRGTVYLREAMAAEAPARVAAAIASAGRGELGTLREDVLRLATHLHPEVRLAVVRVLVRVQGEDATRSLETLAAPDEPWEIRAVALRELTARGRSSVVDVLLEDLEAATGTRLQLLLDLLAASGDDRAVPIFTERFRSAPAGEGRPFLRALAFSGAKSAFGALATLFREPERGVTDPDRPGGQLTTVNYIPTLLLNLRGHDQELLELWRALPGEDLARRAHVLATIAGTAAERTDPALQAPLHAVLREVLFDRQEQGQLRVLALNLMTNKVITLDDAFRLKAGLPDEAEPMRRLFADFLHEFF